MCTTPDTPRGGFDAATFAVSTTLGLRSTTASLAWTLVASLALFVPRDASAQLAIIEAFFKNATDVGVYASTSALYPRDELTPASRGGARGFGVEVLYGIGAVTRPSVGGTAREREIAERRARLTARVDSLRRAYAARVADSSLRADSARLWHAPDSLLAVRARKRTDSTLAEVLIKRGAPTTPAGERTDKFTVKPHKPVEPVDTTWLIEFAIGYSQFSSFEFRGAARDSLELRGAVRELPSLSIYATWQGVSVLGGASPYWGARSGLAQLQNVRVYTVPGDSVYTASGSTFQAGVITGLVWGLGTRADVFLEASYVWREFSGVEWGGPAAGKQLRPVFPREFDASAAQLALGIQINVRSEPAKTDGGT
jgi:hypothetical protein